MLAAIQYIVVSYEEPTLTSSSWATQIFGNVSIEAKWRVIEGVVGLWHQHLAD